MSPASVRVAGCLGAMMVCVITGCSDPKNATASNGAIAVPPEQFGTPDEAAAAFVAAAEKYDVPALKKILGSDGEVLVNSGDSIRDRNDAVSFAAQARTRQRIELDSTKATATLIVGPTDWPLPMPLVKRDGGWSFDAASGQQEVLRRRIGRNELDAIDVCHGYVAAQRMYALVKHDGARVNQYAQRVISTPGKQDGLAWQAPDGTWQGPVGERIARFIAEGYKDQYQPYHGYYFKILKGQGPAAPMGQMDFVVDSAMIGGFALVAAPADYLVTGVKTFIVSHTGIVFEKDLGEKTVEQFRAMDRYNPDSTWKPVAGNLGIRKGAMKRLLRTLRGVVGIGLTWAVGWGLVGALLTAILRIFRPGDFDAGENELVAAALFAMAGFLCASAFSLLFALAERRRAVADLSVLRAAAWGGLGAGALPFLTTMTDSMAILFAPLGAAFAAGAVALAKQAARREAVAERTR